MAPVFIKIGNFVIYWYGVMAAIGVLVASLLFQRLALKAGCQQKAISDILVWVVISGLVGARLVHVFTHFLYYSRHPLEIFQLRNGGLAIQGGIIGGLIFLWIYSLAHRLSFFRIGDLVAQVAPLGQAIGRLGCFLHGCCYGKPTNSVIGVYFPALEGKVHPTELYYLVANLAVFFSLRFLSSRQGRPGVIFCLYLMAMGLIRYNLDFLRGDLTVGRLGLYPTQTFGVVLFFIGSFCLFHLMNQPAPEGKIGLDSPEKDEEKKEGGDHG
ncbi:MAG: prolipoprotein diacylglyceryl transferase [Candidatus Omnitrophica bacterium]|nr:prolipoprotein diacylglyceryl transferase [Candidatus Omnitrophota bacterium]